MIFSLDSFVLSLSVFLASSATFVAADGRQSFSGDFFCDRLDEITLDGVGVFVDTADPGFTPTTGDLSVAAYSNKFVPASLPINSPRFRVTNIEIQSICTLLQDDGDDDDGDVQAPSCQLEIDLTYCRKLVAIEKEPSKFELDGGGRNLRADTASGKDLKGKDAADIASGTKAISNCFGTRTGKIMATGTGPDDYAITGGIGGFFGAFGKIKGDIIDGIPGIGGVPLTYNAEIEVCYYRYYDPAY